MANYTEMARHELITELHSLEVKCILRKKRLHELGEFNKELWDDNCRLYALLEGEDG